MKQLDSVGLEFLDRSPVRVSQARVVNAWVGDVFAAVAADPASWGKWCHAGLPDHPNQGHDADRNKATGTTCSAIGPAMTIGAVSRLRGFGQFGSQSG